MSKDHGPSIKDNDKYEALREDGMSKEKAARIANTPPLKMDSRGGLAAYDFWNVDQLSHKATEVGIEGRAHMSKEDLIRTLRG